MQIRLIITEDGLKYKRTIEEGKTWWSVQHDHGWNIISGVPSLKVYPLEPKGEVPPM